MKPIDHARLVLTAIVLVLVACNSVSNAPVAPAQPAAQASDVTFKTPEDAITAYLDGIAHNDINKILQACAINEMGGKYRLDLDVERMGGALQPVVSMAPADYEFYAEINRTYLSSQILNRVKLFAYGLLSSEQVADGSTILQVDPARANRFVKDVDPQRLSSIELKKISPTYKTLMNDARYLKSAARNASIYGADESTERVALFSFEQNYYYIGFTLLRYGDSWKISSQSSPLAGTNVLGVPQRTTVEGFDSLLNGN